MKKVNLKIFSLKYKLLKALTNSIEKDKEAIKEGAEISFKDYAKLKVVECTKSSYSKDDQKLLDEYAKENGITKQITTFKRIEIDEIPTETDEKVNEILATLEDSNDRIIARAASKVANTNK